MPYHYRAGGWSKHESEQRFGEPHGGYRGAMDASAQTYDRDAIDDVWVSEWVEFGLTELSAYLRRYAAFEAYCQRRPVAGGEF